MAGAGAGRKFRAESSLLVRIVVWSQLMSVQPRPGHGSDQRDEQKKENAYKGSRSASITMTHDGGDVRAKAACGGHGRLVPMTDALLAMVIEHRSGHMQEGRSTTSRRIDGEGVHAHCDGAHGRPMMRSEGCITLEEFVDAAGKDGAAHRVLLNSGRSVRSAAGSDACFFVLGSGPHPWWLQAPGRSTCSTLAPFWSLSEAAHRVRLVRMRGSIVRRKAIPSSFSSHLLPVSGRAGARASTVMFTWRSRAFGGGALRQRPTGRIS